MVNVTENKPSVKSVVLDVKDELVEALIKYAGKLDAPPRFTTEDEALQYFQLGPYTPIVEPTDALRERMKAKMEAEKENDKSVRDK